MIPLYLLFYVVLGITATSLLLISPLGNSIPVNEIIISITPSLSGLLSDALVLDPFISQKYDDSELTNSGFSNDVGVSTVTTSSSRDGGENFIGSNPVAAVHSSEFSAGDKSTSWKNDPDVKTIGYAPIGGMTPIIVNFCNEFPTIFYNFGAAHTVTFFDLDSDGYEEPMWVWVDGRECTAIMVIDQNENGIIDNGKELFNPEGTYFNDAFEVLQNYSNYSNVYFWFDVPHLDASLDIIRYGTTENGELKSLDDLDFSHVDFDNVVHLGKKSHYVDDQFIIYDEKQPSPLHSIRSFAYCESCIIFNNGTTLAALDAYFNYNNRIGLPLDRSNVTFLTNNSTEYVAQKDGEIIIANHMDNILSAGDKKEILIFANAGNDNIDCGMFNENLCFGGYGDDTICGLGFKFGGQQNNTISSLCSEDIFGQK